MRILHLNFGIIEVVSRTSPFANVQFANIQRRFVNVFGCSKYVSLLSAGMKDLKRRPIGEFINGKSGISIRFFFLANVLVHAFFSCL